MDFFLNVSFKKIILIPKFDRINPCTMSYQILIRITFLLISKGHLKALEQQ